MMEDSHFNSSYFWSPVPTVQGQVRLDNTWAVCIFLFFLLSNLSVYILKFKSVLKRELLSRFLSVATKIKSLAWINVSSRDNELSTLSTDWECHVPEQGQRATGEERVFPSFLCAPLPNSSPHHPHSWGQDRWRRPGWECDPPPPSSQHPEHHRAACPLHRHHDSRWVCSCAGGGRASGSFSLGECFCVFPDSAPKWWFLGWVTDYCIDLVLNNEVTPAQ